MHTYVPVTVDRLHQLDELLVAVRSAVQRPEYRRKLLNGLEIPGGITTVRVLRAVENHPEGSDSPSIGDVAARLAVEHSTASRSVDAAVRQGWLRKQTCERDMRRTRLTLTRQGRGVLAKTSARRRQLLDTVTEGWPTEDIDQLIALLDALRQGFDRLDAFGSEHRSG